MNTLFALQLLFLSLCVSSALESEQEPQNGLRKRLFSPTHAIEANRARRVKGKLPGHEEALERSTKFRRAQVIEGSMSMSMETPLAGGPGLAPPPTPAPTPGPTPVTITTSATVTKQGKKGKKRARY
eukprot:CAMPEP_0194068296 /NCGR_PEP_ID=MMETSP0009_2-20130614/87018_1 /TAXON_ID=210454 /ORGANISM="Grammatophora oceanica, Strain CCMP 410" /LENGTH=126 /DNA_ID=CAMNT_0038721381 /DNA_START=102 /DNA_END=482 /DNA_ORIENTATION=+